MEIDRADIAVLLVTQQFVISPFIMDEEPPRILARHKKGEMEVLPLLVQPTPLRDLPTGGFLQWAPGKPTPLSAYLDRGDNAFAEACNEVLEALGAVIQRVRARKSGEASLPGPHRGLEATHRNSGNEHVVGDQADSSKAKVDLPTGTPVCPAVADSKEPRAMELVAQRVKKKGAPHPEPPPPTPEPFPAPPEGEGPVRALVREIPILAKKTLRASSYSCALRLDPDERRLLVTLEVFFQGDPIGTHIFHLPDSSHDFWVDEHDKAVVSMKIRSKEVFNLGRYDPETACALVNALARLNALLGEK